MTGPIYVGGATRSGKTLMRWLLSSHSRLAVSRRAEMWPRFYARYGDLAQPGNLELCLQAMLARPQVAALVTDPAQIREDFVRGSATYGRLFALVQEQFAAQSGKPRWGDQSGRIEAFAEPVLAAYPEAKILHLIRDPRDRHEAVAARDGPLRPGAAGQSAASWLRSARLARHNASRWPDNYRVVRYETLVSRPEETVEEVCAFLGEGFEPAMLRLEGARRYDHDRVEDGGSPISTAYVGRYRGRISRADLNFIQRVTGRRMDDFGFALAPVPIRMRQRSRLAVHWPVNLACFEAERLRRRPQRSVVAR
jgi:Sulfotransferase family